MLRNTLVFRYSVISTLKILTQRKAFFFPGSGLFTMLTLQWARSGQGATFGLLNSPSSLMTPGLAAVRLGRMGQTVSSKPPTRHPSLQHTSPQAPLPTGKKPQSLRGGDTYPSPRNTRLFLRSAEEWLTLSVPPSALSHQSGHSGSRF